MAHSFKRAVIKTATVKKQSEPESKIETQEIQDKPENKNIDSNDGFGYFQWINFGKKHKNTTVYDIANQRDFGYLKWLLRQTKPNEDFRISQSTIPHIHAALRIQDDNTDSWKLDWTDLGNNEFKLQYKSEKGILGPSINYKYCVYCRKKKMSNLFGNEDMCNMCNKGLGIPV